MNEFKYNKHYHTVYGFYDLTSDNNFIRFEDYSFNLDHYYQTSGNSFYVKVLFVHFPTIEEYNNFNIDEISNIKII